jgi:hypothetical protein
VVVRGATTQARTVAAVRERAASKDVVYDVVADERRGGGDGYGHHVILRVLRFSREETRWPRRTV